MAIIKKNKAFTLVELLVVISIIALMLAILLPALGKARRLARNAVCQSNLRQIGVGVSCYTNDNKNIMPYSWDSTNGDATKNNWVSLLASYVGGANKSVIDTFVAGGKVNRVWMCPEYKAASYGFSYSMNRCMSFVNGKYYNSTRRTYPIPRKSYEIKSPGNRILVADASSTTITNPEFTSSSISLIMYPGYGIRHNDKANCLMADLHIDWETHNSDFTWLKRFPDIDDLD